MVDGATSTLVPVVEGEVRHLGHGVGWKGFFRHYGEMVAAMMPGCIIGCALWAGFLGTWADTSGLTTIAMALLMAATMGAWMLRRRHTWRSVLEMSASMAVVPVVLIPLLWVGQISSLTIHGVTMMAMLPAMLAVMLYRRHDYLSA